MNMYICTVYVYIHMFMYIFKYQSFIVLSEQLVDFHQAVVVGSVLGRLGHCWMKQTLCCGGVLMVTIPETNK